MVKKIKNNDFSKVEASKIAIVNFQLQEMNHAR